jgi:hypothetical protein
MYVMYFRHKSGCSATLPTPPISFTAFTDHPTAEEVQPGCGPQSCMVPVRIPIGFWSRAMESVGGAVLSWAWSLALSKWTVAAAPIWKFQKGQTL